MLLASGIMWNRGWMLVAFASLLQAQSTVWRDSSGEWTDAAHWSGGMPTGFLRAIVRGKSTLHVPPGTWLAADLQVGVSPGDRASVLVDGGQVVLLQDSLHIGEDPGGEGEVVLRSGALHCVMDVFVGGASGVPHRENKATLRVQGGSFLGRTLTVGMGIGSDALLSIEGSGASAVHALDYVQMEGTSTLAFVLDAQGVTPITVQSRVQGLRLAAHSHLRVTLKDVPPRRDIRLVAAHAAARGTFEGLPEGSEIMAEFGGQTYRWRLTYHGGSGNDLVLKADGAQTEALPPVPAVPVPLWTEHRLFPLEAVTGTPAFAGAEGFGAFTPGGRGGATIDVDNLNDSGPGSLRAALETKGPRTVRFRVGGTIELKSPIRIVEPYLTLDGQSAPGDGIAIRRHGLEVRTHDVVLRYFRVRIGDEDVDTAGKGIEYYTGGEGDYAVYILNGAHDVIADHLSLSWSTAKTLSTTLMTDRITVQYCILSESLNFADHAYASITSGNRVSWHHNLFAHHLDRNVRFQGMVDADFRNNVVYDWGTGAAYGEFDLLNYVGNYLKPGPSTTQRPPLFHTGVAVVAAGSIYVADNVMEGNEAVNKDNWRGMGVYYYERKQLEATRPFPAAAVTTEPAREAYEHVLKDAGATLPRRDAVDERVVREVRNGSGKIVKWVREIQPQ